MSSSSVASKLPPQLCHDPALADESASLFSAASGTRLGRLPGSAEESLAPRDLRRSLKQHSQMSAEFLCPPFSLASSVYAPTSSARTPAASDHQPSWSARIWVELVSPDTARPARLARGRHPPSSRGPSPIDPAFVLRAVLPLGAGSSAPRCNACCPPVRPVSVSLQGPTWHGALSTCESVALHLTPPVLAHAACDSEHPRFRV